VSEEEKVLNKRRVENEGIDKESMLSREVL